MKPRYYFHGDVVENDPTKFYNARGDLFEDISGFVPELEDYRRLKFQLKNARACTPARFQRPKDASNVLAGSMPQRMPKRFYRTRLGGIRPATLADVRG